MTLWAIVDKAYVWFTVWILDPNGMTVLWTSDMKSIIDAFTYYCKDLVGEKLRETWNAACGLDSCQPYMSEEVKL